MPICTRTHKGQLLLSELIGRRPYWLLLNRRPLTTKKKERAWIFRIRHRGGSAAGLEGTELRDWTQLATPRCRLRRAGVPAGGQHRGHAHPPADLSPAWRWNWNTANASRIPTYQDHPILTGKIVLAHLKETMDYYQRLDVAELEGRPFKAMAAKDLNSKPKSTGKSAQGARWPWLKRNPGRCLNRYRFIRGVDRGGRSPGRRQAPVQNSLAPALGR